MSGIRMIKDEIIIRRPNNTKKVGSFLKAFIIDTTFPAHSFAHVIARCQRRRAAEKMEALNKPIPNRRPAYSPASGFSAIAASAADVIFPPEL